MIFQNCWPFTQLGPASPARYVTNRDGDSLLLANKHNQLLASGNTGIEQVPLEHGVVLRHDRNDDRGVFRSLALMNGRGIGRPQHGEFTEAIGHDTTVEACGEFVGVGINVVDVADVAIIDFLVVVVLNLHDLVTGSKGPTEPRYLPVASRVQCRLELDVE